MRKVMRTRGEEKHKKAIVYLKDYQYRWIKEKGINFSRFVQEKIDEEMFIPLFIIEIASADESVPPVGSVILLTKEKKGEIKVASGGRRYLRVGKAKLFVRVAEWESVHKKKVVYIWD